jgi:isocitrate dehydrogenase
MRLRFYSLISDAATMQIIRWTQGGFGMSAHNYDGDMLTDEIAQVHRSPGFITSNLAGKDAHGHPIREFEASHGTVTDLWNDHLAGKETSMNPLGMAEALLSVSCASAPLTRIRVLFCVVCLTITWLEKRRR